MQDTEKKLLVPALRTSLQQKRIQLEQVEFSVSEQGRIRDRAMQEASSADKIQAEKRRLAASVREEVEALERMVKEYSK